MLTVTSGYALRAITCLATHENNAPLTARAIAERAGVPAKYLSKILGDLVRRGVLQSTPGKTGGFRLRRSAKETFLFDVLEPFEHFEDICCPLGKTHCTAETPCVAHRRWRLVAQAQLRFLRETSVHEVTASTKRFQRDARMSKEGPSA